MIPPGSDPPLRNERWLVAVALLLIGMMFAQGLSWGLPYPWEYDEISSRSLLTSLVYGPERKWPARYPLFHMHVLDLTTSIVARVETLRHAVFNSPPLHVDSQTGYAIRWTSVAMALATLLFARLIALELFHDRRAGFLGMIAAGLNVPMFYYAKVGNLDVPYVFWSSAGLWFYLRALRRGRTLDHVLLAATVTLSVATKDQAYALWVLAPIPLVLALRARHRAGGARHPLLAALLDPRILLSLLTALALFAVAAGIVGHPDFFRDHVRVITGANTDDARMFERTIPGFARMALHAFVHVGWSMGLPLLLTAGAGIILALNRPRREAAVAASLLLPLLSYYAFFICAIFYHLDRYFLVFFVVLSVFAGRALALLVSLRGSARHLGRAVAAAVLLWSALRAQTINRLLLDDSRARIETWALEAAPGKVITVGTPAFEMLPHLPRVSYRDAMASDGGVFLRNWDADYVVANATETFHSYGLDEPRFLERMRRRDTAVFPVFKVGQRIRYDFVGLDECFAGLQSNLCYVSPELEVFQTLRGSWIDWALTRASGSASELSRLAREERELGRFDNARALAEEATCLDPDDPEGLVVLAHAAIDAGRDGEAEQLALTALERDPGNAGALLARARLLSHHGQHRLAARDAWEAVYGASDDPRALLLAADALRVTGEPSLAMTALGAIRAPDFAPIHAEVARRYAELGAPANARRAYLRFRPLEWGWRPPKGWTADLQALAVENRAPPTTMTEKWNELPPPVVRSGIYGLESEDSGDPFRWSEDRVVMTVEGPPLAALLEIEYECSLGVPQTLELRVSGARRTSFVCAGHQRGKLTAPLVPDDWRDSVFADLELRVTPTSVPKDSPGVHDPRRLGVRLRSISLAKVR